MKAKFHYLDSMATSRNRANLARNVIRQTDEVRARLFSVVLGPRRSPTTISDSKATRQYLSRLLSYIRLRGCASHQFYEIIISQRSDPKRRSTILHSLCKRINVPYWTLTVVNSCTPSSLSRTFTLIRLRYSIINRPTTVPVHQLHVNYYQSSSSYPLIINNLLCSYYIVLYFLFVYCVHCISLLCSHMANKDM